MAGGREAIRAECSRRVPDEEIVYNTMTRNERYQFITEYFRARQPHVTTELEFSTPFQLLCATLLSAQCTDKRVNMVTPALFARYPSSKEMAQATPDDILELIHSVSYPNSKARHLVGMAQKLESEFGGEVPDDPKQLMTLPGVGRKTANVVEAVWFGKAVMPVDTHVYRVSHRLGLVPKTCNTPLKVEEYLVRNFAEEDVANAHHWLLLHGRYICKSARPLCDKCPFDSFCPKELEDSKL